MNLRVKSREGAYAGKIATAILADANQIMVWGLK